MGLACNLARPLDLCCHRVNRILFPVNIRSAAEGRKPFIAIVQDIFSEEGCKKLSVFWCGGAVARHVGGFTGSAGSLYGWFQQGRRPRAHPAAIEAASHLRGSPPARTLTEDLTASAAGSTGRRKPRAQERSASAGKPGPMIRPSRTGRCAREGCQALPARYVSRAHLRPRPETRRARPRLRAPLQFLAHLRAAVNTSVFSFSAQLFLSLQTDQILAETVFALCDVTFVACDGVLNIPLAPPPPAFFSWRFYLPDVSGMHFPTRLGIPHPGTTACLAVDLRPRERCPRACLWRSLALTRSPGHSLRPAKLLFAADRAAQALGR